MNLEEAFGQIDVYLFDQLLRGQLRPGMSVLDAGCGSGRNLVYLLQNGFDVFAVDRDSRSVQNVDIMAANLAPKLPAGQFIATPIESLPFRDGRFDYVICNAVLHFAHGEDHFHSMLAEMARVLRPGGIFFARLMSTVGVESIVYSLGKRRYQLPDGQPVFLVDEPYLLAATQNTFRGTLADPLKSTVVHGKRTMTTWVVKKGG